MNAPDTRTELMAAFDLYQQRAWKTAFYPGKRSGFNLYTVVGLCGEAGEVAEKAKKIFRDRNGDPTNRDVDVIGLELGDVLWYIAAIASELGLSLGEVAEVNLRKLESRRVRGKLSGEGDER